MQFARWRVLYPLWLVEGTHSIDTPKQCCAILLAPCPHRPKPFLKSINAPGSLQTSNPFLLILTIVIMSTNMTQRQTILGKTDSQEEFPHEQAHESTANCINRILICQNWRLKNTFCISGFDRAVGDVRERRDGMDVHAGVCLGDSINGSVRFERVRVRYLNVKIEIDLSSSIPTVLPMSPNQSKKNCLHFHACFRSHSCS